jgi:cytosine/uracil/thiamine/allantoin permease
VGGIQVKVSQIFSEKKARKWMWVGLVAFVALQVYFVQEMLAALMLFTGVFVIFALIALVLYLVDRAGQWGLGWAGQRARPALQLARRGWAAAEDLSKKPFRRPRSETAQ